MIFIGVEVLYWIVWDEVFGFVLFVFMFCMFVEVIVKVNNMLYGFFVGIWFDKGFCIFVVVDCLCVGVVWVNIFNCFDLLSLFGGYKEFGYGCEGGC